MKAAAILTLLGSILLALIGNLYLNLEFSVLIGAWIAANVLGGADLILTLEFQRRRILRSPLMSWVFFLGFWGGGLMGWIPALREPRVLAFLFLPLGMCTGPCIMIWGEFQDWQVARRQRALSSKHS